MAVGDASGDKRDFSQTMDEVCSRLARLSTDSPIRRCFPQSRLDTIRAKIAATIAEKLELGRWQPLFLFLRNCSDAALSAFDDDLRLVGSHSAGNDRKTFEFLISESEAVQPWAGGIFELYVKAAALRSAEVSNTILDWPLPNGRRPDLKIDLDGNSICLECTGLGESDASDARWSQHLVSLQENRDAVLCERPDAYTQSRRLYAKVFDKLAPKLDVHKSQMSNGGPNLLLISLNYLSSPDLTANSSAVGWALEELFADQPNGNHGSVSLCDWLLRQRKHAQPDVSSFDDLLAALASVSGILIFDGCKLGIARINYNADSAHMISHAQMAAVEQLFSVPPLYAQ